jgi:hypothetical protein
MFTLFQGLNKKPPVPKPLEHWFADITNVERLRELLKDPVFQTASASLISAAQPSFGCTTQPSEINDRTQAWLAGYNDAFRDLVKLTKAPVSSGANNLPSEWGHLTPTEN